MYVKEPQEGQNSLRNLSVGTEGSVNGSATSSSGSLSEQLSSTCKQLEDANSVRHKHELVIDGPASNGSVINEPPKPLAMELKPSTISPHDQITPKSINSSNSISKPIAIKSTHKYPYGQGLTLPISPSNSKSSIADPLITSLDVVSTSSSLDNNPNKLSSSTPEEVDKESVKTEDSNGQYSVAENSLLGLKLENNGTDTVPGVSPTEQVEVSSNGGGFFTNVFGNSLPTPRKQTERSFTDSEIKSSLSEIDIINESTGDDSIADSKIDISVSSVKMQSYRPSATIRKDKQRSTSTTSSNIAIESPLKQVNVAENVLDKTLYSEETLDDTDIHYASESRHSQFLQIFASDASGRLLDDFACALTRPELPLLPLQGRLYVSCKGIRFYSSILGWTTNISLNFGEIEKFERSFSVGVFNNGIKVFKTNNKGEVGFVGFVKRDSVLELLESVFECYKKKFNNNNSRRESQLDIEKENNQENPDDSAENEYQSALMSIDGDTPKVRRFISDSESEYSEEEDDEDDEESSKQTSPIHKFKTNSKYTASKSTIYEHESTAGPSLNPPIHPNEKKLLKETLSIPPSLLFQLLFENSNTDLILDFLKSQDSTDFSEFSEYTTNSDGIKERTYSYQKALNFPVGPKSTTCEVSDQIIQEDPNTYYEIINITKTPSVPSGGAFDVRTRYILTWGPQNNTILRISYWVQWTGTSWMKGVIERSCETGQRSATEDLGRLIADYCEEYVETVAGESVLGVSDTGMKKKKRKAKNENVAFKRKVNISVKEEKPADIKTPVQTVSTSIPATTTTGFLQHLGSQVTIFNYILFTLLLIIIIQQSILISKLLDINTNIVNQSHR